MILILKNIKIKKLLINIVFIVFINNLLYGQNPLNNNTFLPKPTGNYIVGTKNFYITDSTRFEKFKKRKNKFRRYNVKAWYPSDSTYGKYPEKYLDQYKPVVIADIFKSKGATEDIMVSIMKNNTYSYCNVPVSDKLDKYPVIIFSHGYYFGISELYSAFMENLASNGYIVLSITHPYEQPYAEFSDGTVATLIKKYASLAFLQWSIIEKLQFRKTNTPEKNKKVTINYLRKLKRFDKSLDLWVDDTRNLIDQLENRNIFSFFNNKIDIDNIGISGQSFGGAVAGQCCLVDERIKAGINLDCFQFGDVIDNDFKKPFMLIESEKNVWQKANKYIYSKQSFAFYSITIKNSKHFIFSDVAIFPNITSKERFGLIGNVNGYETISIINEYSLDFFNFTLKNQFSEKLEKQIDNKYIKLIYRTNNESSLKR
ncbi:MAG: hypothetical protein KAT68_07875 [Bacteroidales bacterium]|nr:hypothetical protein [Bacteroidales bacterium]